MGWGMCNPVSPGCRPIEPTGQPAAHPDDDVRLSAELAAVVSGARRRAVRGGDRQIDTAHLLLHSLLESDPEVRSVFDSEPRLARLMGYLVQRSTSATGCAGRAASRAPVPYPW
ncbi:hypothetical protein SALBM311S_07504 [Streptomyces alboniger]